MLVYRKITSLPHGKIRGFPSKKHVDEPTKFCFLGPHFPTETDLGNMGRVKWNSKSTVHRTSNAMMSRNYVDLKLVAMGIKLSN